MSGQTVVSRSVRAACAVGAGALLGYFLDPERGRTRRIQAKDQFAGVLRRSARKAARTVEQKREYSRDRTQGLIHELRHPQGTEPENDQTLVEKVRSEVLGQPRYSEAAINVDAADGVVTLRGELDQPDDIRELRDAVGRIRGVREVQSYLHPPGTPAPNKQDARNAR